MHLHKVLCTLPGALQGPKGHPKASGGEPLRQKRGPTKARTLWPLGLADKATGTGKFKKTVTRGKQEKTVKRTREKVNDWGTSGTEKKVGRLEKSREKENISVAGDQDGGTRARGENAGFAPLTASAYEAHLLT